MLDGLDGRPLGVDGARASEVAVTYQTVTMIPIPGMVAKQFNITRTVQMRTLDN